MSDLCHAWQVSEYLIDTDMEMWVIINIMVFSKRFGTLVHINALEMHKRQHLVSCLVMFLKHCVHDSDISLL